MEQQKKYEPLRNLDAKLEKYVNDKVDKKYSIYNITKIELDNLKKEVANKLNSMKEKGLEETYIYEKYRGEQEEIISKKSDELNSLFMELDLLDSWDYGISVDDFIIFVSNAFKVNGEILKESMKDFVIEDYTNDVLKNIKIPNSSEIEYWKNSIDVVEKKYNSKINCLNIIGKGTLNNFIQLGGFVDEKGIMNMVDEGMLIETLDQLDPSYSLDFNEVYDEEPIDYDEETLITFIFRKNVDEKALKNLSFNLALNLKVCLDFDIDAELSCLLLDKFNKPVLDKIIKSDSCKDILGDLLNLLNNKMEYYDYETYKILEDPEVIKLINQINKKYSPQANELNNDEFSSYVDEDSKDLSNSNPDYPGSGEGGRSAK